MSLDNEETLLHQLTGLIGRDMANKIVDFFGDDIGDLHELFRRLDQWTTEFATEGANTSERRAELKAIVSQTITGFIACHPNLGTVQFEVVCNETNNTASRLEYWLTFDLLFKLSDADKTNLLFFRNLELEPS